MSNIKLFESKQIRSEWNEAEQKWYFSVVDIVGILSDSPNPRNYWKVLKHRLAKEGNESVTNCNQLKMQSADGKYYNTDVADTKQLLRLIQSIPSPKAEPFKLWLAQVGSDRLDEIENPELSAQEKGKKIEAKSLFVLFSPQYNLAKAFFYLFSIASPLKARQLNSIVHGFSRKK
jgi:hypothetical protein